MPGRLKELMLKEYARNLEGLDSMFSISYNGVKVEESNDLRNRLFQAGNSLLHVRNRIFHRALEDRDISGFKDYVRGPSAVVYGDDIIAGIKLVTEFAKGKKGVELQGGLFEGELLGKEEVQELSLIPPRPVLLAQVAMTAQAPITGAASLLQGLLQKLVSTVAEIEKQKA